LGITSQHAAQFHPGDAVRVHVKQGFIRTGSTRRAIWKDFDATVIKVTTKRIRISFPDTGREMLVEPLFVRAR